MLVVQFVPVQVCQFQVHEFHVSHFRKPSKDVPLSEGFKIKREKRSGQLDVYHKFHKGEGGPRTGNCTIWIIYWHER